MAVSSPTGQERPLRFPLSRQRRKVWLISVIVLSLSALGLVLSWTNPQIRSPLRPGLDFTGGTKIQLERLCKDNCQEIRAIDIQQTLGSLTLPAEGRDQDGSGDDRQEHLPRPRDRRLLRVHATGAGRALRFRGLRGVVRENA